MSWTTLCDLSELTENQGKYVEIDGFQLAVFIDNDRVFVMDNTCPHAGGNLAGGYVEEGCAVCPWHHWAFRLESGELKDLPGVMVSTYKTRLYEHEGRHFVQADLPEPGRI
jgi:nitrite reductase (NADH) small subunit/3-phenylpropionate/trans-cinnamate dioxygenase ferredoxin subunit